MRYLTYYERQWDTESDNKTPLATSAIVAADSALGAATAVAWKLGVEAPESEPVADGVYNVVDEFVIHVWPADIIPNYQAADIPKPELEEEGEE